MNPELVKQTGEYIKAAMRGTPILNNDRPAYSQYAVGYSSGRNEMFTVILTDMLKDFVAKLERRCRTRVLRRSPLGTFMGRDFGPDARPIAPERVADPRHTNFYAEAQPAGSGPSNAPGWVTDNQGVPDAPEMSYTAPEEPSAVPGAPSTLPEALYIPLDPDMTYAPRPPYAAAPERPYAVPEVPYRGERPYVATSERPSALPEVPYAPYDAGMSYAATTERTFAVPEVPYRSQRPYTAPERLDTQAMSYDPMMTYAQEVSYTTAERPYVAPSRGADHQPEPENVPSQGQVVPRANPQSPSFFQAREQGGRRGAPEVSQAVSSWVTDVHEARRDIPEFVITAPGWNAGEQGRPAGPLEMPGEAPAHQQEAMFDDVEIPANVERWLLDDIEIPVNVSGWLLDQQGVLVDAPQISFAPPVTQRVIVPRRPPFRRDPWTEEEKERAWDLQVNHALSQAEIGRVLNRTRSAVGSQLARIRGLREDSRNCKGSP